MKKIGDEADDYPQATNGLLGDLGQPGPRAHQGGEGPSKSGSKTDRLIRGRDHACVASQATKGRGFFTMLSPPLRALFASATDV